ncbi:hypothetical protein AB0C45_28350 [Streptomyces cyaneofuscatus]|uniref:hypothetical protein n=1 Tax=Streptomyces cyaneofuscatus TaxID=66883 RepID=UPI0033C761FD
MVASRVACDWHRGRAHDEALRERLVSRWARRPPDVSEEHWVIAGAAVAGLVFGIALDGGSTDGPSGPATEAKLSAEGWVACSQVMAEGEVVSVEEVPEAGRVLLTVAVTDWFKPATGEKEARFDVVDPAKDGAYPRWKPGEHLLLVIDRDPTAYVTSYRGDDIAQVRRSIERALPGAAGRECTDGGRGDV